MSTFKHTPAPWIADKCRYGFAVYAYKSGDAVVRTEDAEGRYGAIENEADARLIASAPELLSVALAVDDLAERIDHEPDSALGELVARARAAIAKATQEPQE
jgi:hypothetical protein